MRGALLHARLLRQGYTMTSSRRGRALYRLARQVEETGIPGDLVDCGVYNGGSTTLLSAGAPSRRAWAFDSFEGLPEPGPLDGAGSQEFEGDCRGSEERVHEAFRRYAQPEHLRTVKGWFEDTLPRTSPAIERVAILHCDGDWYDSVKQPLEVFYPKLSPGGYAVIDDYGYWVGARQATDEFRRQHGITAPLQRVDDTGVYWRKP